MTHARPARRAAALALAAAAAVLTACGGDSGDDGGEAAATTTAAGTTEATPTTSDATGTTDGGGAAETEQVSVSAVDFAFEVDEDSFAAGEYEFTLNNEGDATHDLVVERDGEDVAKTARINPGEEDTVTVTLEPGEYVLYCSVGNHRQMGMEVRVTVT